MKIPTANEWMSLYDILFKDSVTPPEASRPREAKVPPSALDSLKAALPDGDIVRVRMAKRHDLESMVADLKKWKSEAEERLGMIPVYRKAIQQLFSRVDKLETELHRMKSANNEPLIFGPGSSPSYKPLTPEDVAKVVDGWGPEYTPLNHPMNQHYEPSKMSPMGDIFGQPPRGVSQGVGTGSVSALAKTEPPSPVALQSVAVPDDGKDFGPLSDEWEDTTEPVASEGVAVPDQFGFTSPQDALDFVSSLPWDDEATNDAAEPVPITEEQLLEASAKMDAAKEPGYEVKLIPSSWPVGSPLIVDGIKPSTPTPPEASVDSEKNSPY